VTMKITVGDIELELWAKETPKTCRNFIQLCVEGYYHDPIFRTQGGDPTGTGEGGKIYGGRFKNEFRTRIRSYGRGLIAVANAGKDDNTSQFLFTLGSTLELQSKHTILGKVILETIYNMLKFEKAPVDENDRLLYPPRLLKSIILNNSFSDIIARIIVQKSEEVKDSSKTKTAVVVMKTTFGDIELELWAKETAKAYRNFIQLCMEGYWDDTIFHALGGDPTGTGEGGKIYGEPFQDEFYTRLRFCRRDLIAGTNAGKMTMVPNTSLFLVLHQICRINIQSLVELPVNLYIVCLNTKEHL
ncbi:Peptidyl-prolyl cis-trans isomerase CWC27 like protein, partial [Eufriesea mexicana]